MTLHPSDLLGRDLTFNRADRVGTVRSRATITAFDPKRGWKLSGPRYAPAWVSALMFKRLLATGVLTVSLLLAVDASAQSLKPATFTFTAAAAADLATTYRNLAGPNGGVEYNPMLRFTRNTPVQTVLVGAAYDVAGIWAWNRFVGRRHPKVARAGLYAAAGFRVFLAVSNTQRFRRAR